MIVDSSLSGFLKRIMNEGFFPRCLKTEGGGSDTVSDDGWKGERGAALPP
jgi:hypothetical protein